MSGGTGHGLAECHEILVNHIFIDFHPLLIHQRCKAVFEPVSAKRAFLDLEELPKHAERDGVILVGQDSACVEALFPDACARGESVVGEKG
jgi:hypothetical protein